MRLFRPLQSLRPAPLVMFLPLLKQVLQRPRTARIAPLKAMLEAQAPLPCLIGTVSEMEFVQCREALELALDRHGGRAKVDVRRCACLSHATTGWLGCWDCHKRIAAEAASAGWPAYLVLESKARPALRFDWESIAEAAAIVREQSTWEYVHLSSQPGLFKGWPRERVGRSTYKSARSMMNGTSALMCSRAFARRLLSMEPRSPIDKQLAEEGWARLHAYPSPFQRNSLPSSTTPQMCGQSVLGTPVGYALLEAGAYHSPSIAWALCICVFLCVALMWQGAAVPVQRA